MKNVINRLQQQTVKIKEKKALVMDDLAQVEPAVQDAKQGNVCGCQLSMLNLVVKQTSHVICGVFIFAKVAFLSKLTLSCFNINKEELITVLFHILCIIPLF